MIMGPQDNIYTVALLPEDGPEEFTAKFEAVIEGLDDFLVFADLLGGTPCNVVSRLIMEGRDIDLYAGMNLPMVIEFINASLTGADADYKSRAAESIVKVNDLLAGFDDDEDEYTLRKSLQTTSASPYRAYVTDFSSICNLKQYFELTSSVPSTTSS
ncbi:phosphotransferase system sugar-specific EII component [Streptococcus pneumoniae]|nr:phosphotransferase system sugar-specific EII component [Streptococcus pneumoniae]